MGLRPTKGDEKHVILMRPESELTRDRPGSGFSEEFPWPCGSPKVMKTRHAHETGIGTEPRPRGSGFSTEWFFRGAVVANFPLSPRIQNLVQTFGSIYLTA